MIRAGFHTGQIMVCLVLNGRKLPAGEELAERLSAIPGMTSIMINVNRENTNVIMGKETFLLWGRAFIEDRIGDVTYQISARSFYQVNPVQTERLLRCGPGVRGPAGQRDGVGPLLRHRHHLPVSLARKAGKVYGVEIVPEAIEDARKNAALNGISNAEFFVGKAEEVLPEKYEREGSGRM